MSPDKRVAEADWDRIRCVSVIRSGKRLTLALVFHDAA